jgi:hypothetical protein
MSIHLRSLAYAVGLASAFGLAGLTPGLAQQTGNDLIKLCPDNPAGMVCPESAQSFVGAQTPGRATDSNIIRLVQVISQAGDTPRVTKKVCLNTAEGIVVLGSIVTDAGEKQWVADTAEAMCEGNLGIGMSNLPLPPGDMPTGSLPDGTIVVKPLPGSKEPGRPVFVDPPPSLSEPSEPVEAGPPGGGDGGGDGGDGSGGGGGDEPIE